ncbi:MAG: hypothetical protein JXR41_04505 [Bacteroidales bacterium]|nr:hypothetical protein [Bacteroidales bacterium]
MNTNLYIRPVSIALLLLIPVISTGMQVEHVKEFKKEFPVDKDTRLEITNKYGNVDIKDWNNQSIAIDVKIIVRSGNKEKADKVFDYIMINMEQEGNLVRATTEFRDNLSNVLRNVNNEEKGLEINYSVYMPKNVPLNLSNKYGNVFINELTSTSNIEVKYGKLTANKILHDSQQPLTQITLGYSNATIQECKWIKVDIKYSKLQISQSQAIIFMSKYSKIYLDEGSSLVSESKYDTYELGHLNNLVATAGYTHYTLKELKNKLQIDSKYTDVTIENVPEGFKLIKIANSYGSYKIGISPDASYHIEGYAKYCKIVYPEDNSRVSRFNENTEMKVNGLVGTDENTKSSIIVNSSYGNIKLVR